MTKYTVRFTRQQINLDAYHIDIEASSPEEAKARFNAWAGNGASLTAKEEQSERHVKDYGIVDSYGAPVLEGGFDPVAL